MVQGELFREEHAGLGLDEKPKSFLARQTVTLTLDKALIACVGFVIIFALTFSFGVERGKRAMEKEMTSFATDKKAAELAPNQPSHISQPDPEAAVTITLNQGPEPVQTPSLPPTPEPTQTVAPKISEPVSSALPLADQTRSGAFTIQLVTYANEGQALREIERLRARGFKGFAIPSGRFYQICIDYFDSKDLARTTVQKIKQTGRYPDAFVRPVVR